MLVSIKNNFIVGEVPRHVDHLAPRRQHRVVLQQQVASDVLDVDVLLDISNRQLHEAGTAQVDVTSAGEGKLAAVDVLTDQETVEQVAAAGHTTGAWQLDDDTVKSA